MSLSRSTCKVTLLGTFVVGLAVQVAVVAVLLGREAVFLDEASRLVLILFQIYSVPLGVALAGVFARRAERSAPVDHKTFWVALTVSILWNLLLIWQTGAFALAEAASLAAFTKTLADIAAGASFLVAAALAYFFAKD